MIRAKCNDSNLLHNSPKYYKYTCNITFKQSDDDYNIYIEEIVDHKSKPVKSEIIVEPERHYKKILSLNLLTHHE